MSIPVSRQLEGVRILLVDDLGDWRDSLGAMLGAYGAVVWSCASVAEARVRLRQRRYDLLVSDVHMPHEDGLSFIASIGEYIHGGCGLRAIAMSSCDDAEMRRRVISAGFDAFVSKRASIATLIERLQDLARPDWVRGERASFQAS